MRILFLIMFYILSICTCSSQQKVKKDIPEKYNKNYIKYIVPENLEKKAVDVTKYFPENFVKDGTVDYTEFIQRALDQNIIVKFSKMNYLTTGISINSNSKIFFEEGAVLTMKTNDLERYAIISLVGVENVELFNPCVDGDLERRNSFKGEWGFGIDIRGSRNINLYSPYISNCFGDGIVISKSLKGVSNKQLLNSSNIYIKNAYINHSGRNGISIIGVDGLIIEDPIIFNTFTKRPTSAIDIEPDGKVGVLNNIVINKPFTFNNVDGIMISLRKMLNEGKSIFNLVVNNHIDVESYFPINIPDLVDNKKFTSIQGEIIFNDPIWINNDHSMVRGFSYNLSPKIIINKPEIIGLKLKRWKGESLKNLSKESKLEISVKDKDNFTINYL